MSEERAVHNVTDQQSGFKEYVEGDPEIRHRRMSIAEAVVGVHLDATGGALPGHSGTTLNGIDIGGITTGITVESNVNEATRITIRMLALPTEIEVMGTVELDVREPIL